MDKKLNGLNSKQYVKALVDISHMIMYAHMVLASKDNESYGRAKEDLSMHLRSIRYFDTVILDSVRRVQPKDVIRITTNMPHMQISK